MNNGRIPDWCRLDELEEPQDLQEALLRARKSGADEGVLRQFREDLLIRHHFPGQLVLTYSGDDGDHYQRIGEPTEEAAAMARELRESIQATGLCCRAHLPPSESADCP